MKNSIIRTILILILTAFTALTGPAQNGARNQPIGHGDEAVKKLKQNGQYDSLLTAFKTAGRESGPSAAAPPLPPSFAVGQSAKLVAPDGALGDGFGNSLAVSGNTAIIGSPGTNSGQGSAYIFVSSGTTWTLQQKLTASDGASNNYFGNVAIDGDTAIVGATGASGNRGAAYVFVRSGTTWTQQAKLVAADGTAGDKFGVVSISGSTAVIGAYVKNVGTHNFQGAVYVFVRSGTTWTQQQKLTIADGADNDQFGYSVAISGETLISGTPFVNSSSPPEGAAYIFVRTGGTTWSLQQKLTSSTGLSFGNSVAISGETVVVGDPHENSQHGAAFVYVRAGSSWNQQAHLLAADGAANDNFANSVAISGDTVVSGAYISKGRVNGQGSGSAYIFSRTGTTWTQQRKLTVADGAVFDLFGGTVALSGKNIFIAAVGDDIGSNPDQGSAYVFSQRADFDFDGDVRADISVYRPADSIWYALSSTGGFAAAGWGSPGDKPVPADYDGDGKTDYCVFRGNGLGDPNKSYFFILKSSDNTVQSEQFGRAGDNPLAVGDWDGDGKADVAVYRDGATAGEASYFYYHPSSQPSVSFVSVPWGTFGDKPVTGDYDGDGLTDAAVFRPSNAVWYVYRSSDNGFQATGWGLSTDKLLARDFDGDGKTDLAVFRNGDWYILQSSNNQFRAISWGLGSDTPVPADYDGDGKADAAVYRGGSWYILRSSDNQFVSIGFGTSSDTPLASIY